MAKIPSHRILAINRGEKEEFLKVKIDGTDEKIVEYLNKRVLIQKGTFKDILEPTIEDAYKRLIKPSVENEVSGFAWDKKMKKIDNVEATILKLPEVFTREQVRQLMNVSDSTLNRALDSLKKQNKIRPNGTGRSATWVRLVDDEFINNSTKQMSLFELTMDIED